MNNKPKRTHRVLNHPQYNKALAKRGDLTLWINEEVLEHWHAVPTGKPGRPRIYSDAAIQAILLLNIVLRSNYRAITETVASLLRMMRVTLPIPSYTTLSRRLGTLIINLPRLSAPTEPLVIAIDSTGLKIYGEGEWSALGDQQGVHGAIP